MQPNSFEIYDLNKSSSVLPEHEFDNKLVAPELYQPSVRLIDAVNVALSLGQPLLLTGEPGTGKTQLAYHLAHYFGLGAPIVFDVKTSSTANDLFYRYEALKHFQQTQVNNKSIDFDKTEEIEQHFIRYQALGKAIKRASDEGKRSVVLIDEIDKAPRDLPNDILGALERLEFEVPELNKVGTNRIKADDRYRPIIILTSNSEKSLPDAFLRRCVFFHIEYPSPAELKEIIQAKVHDLSPHDLTFITRHFNKVRDLCQNKQPATAELLFWVAYLRKRGFKFAKLSGELPLTDIEKKTLHSSYSILAKSREDLQELIQSM